MAADNSALKGFSEMKQLNCMIFDDFPQAANPSEALMPRSLDANHGTTTAISVSYMTLLR